MSPQIRLVYFPLMTFNVPLVSFASLSNKYMYKHFILKEIFKGYESFSSNNFFSKPNFNDIQITSISYFLMYAVYIVMSSWALYTLCAYTVFELMLKDLRTKL